MDFALWKRRGRHIDAGTARIGTFLPSAPPVAILAVYAQQQSRRYLGAPL